MSTNAKVHNSPGSMGAKVKLRANALDYVTPARVLDCYCGPVGEMHAAVWHRAAEYTGIDEDFRWPDKRCRFVADTCTVLRSIDLTAFNVFDIDAFGSPWEAADIIAQRRRWAKGELGAVLFTDGSSLKSRWGGAPRAAASLAGMKRMDIAPCIAAGRNVSAAAMRGWLARSNVTPLKRWDAEGRGLGLSSLLMLYTAIVFEGA